MNEANVEEIVALLNRAEDKIERLREWQKRAIELLERHEHYMDEYTGECFSTCPRCLALKLIEEAKT